MQKRIPAVFMRGGTSKAVFFHENHLPKDPHVRDRVILVYDFITIEIVRAGFAVLVDISFLRPDHIDIIILGLYDIRMYLVLRICCGDFHGGERVTTIL